MSESKNEKVCKDPKSSSLLAMFNKLDKEEQLAFLGAALGMAPIPKFATENVTECTTAQLNNPDAVTAIKNKPAPAPKR